jgi:hypothetical protein
MNERVRQGPCLRVVSLHVGDDHVENFSGSPDIFAIIDLMEGPLINPQPAGWMKRLKFFERRSSDGHAVIGGEDGLSGDQSIGIRLERTMAPYRRGSRGTGKPVSAPEKGIVVALPSNGGCGTVSRVYPDLIAQGKDLIHHPLDQLVVVAAGKIGPSDGTCEQGIPGKYGSGRVKADPSRRMTRRVND